MMNRLVPVLVVLFAACGGSATLQESDDPAAAQAQEPTSVSSPPAQLPSVEQSASTQQPPPVTPPPKDPYIPTKPLTTKPGEWTWVDLPDSKCANGSPTGIGVNLSNTSDEVLVFLQGGGACWDGATCYGVNTAFYVATGYGRLEFETDIMKPAVLPMRKDDSNNPFRDMNIIYVPYCTGDVHSGDSVQEYEFLGDKKVTYHHGYKNLGLALDKVQATFPNVKHIWLAGDSAGGFGSALNLDRTQRRFPNARVDVLDDSGQPIEPAAGKWQQWRSVWNLQLPEDCTDCASGVHALVEYYKTKYPNNTFALLSWSDDSVITPFMGLLPSTFLDELLALKAEVDTDYPAARYYVLPGALHVTLATPTPGLEDWLDQLVKGKNPESVSPF